MITSFEAQEASPLRLPLVAPVLVGHFQGHLDRRAAIVGEEHPPFSPAQRAQEQFGQGDAGRMREAGEMDVVPGLGRFSQGRHQRAVAVPVQDGPPRRNPVDQAATIGQLEELVFGAHGQQRQVGLAQRRVGMPYAAPIPLDQVGNRVRAGDIKGCAYAATSRRSDLGMPAVRDCPCLRALPA